jgi:hypothetical protein
MCNGGGYFVDGTRPWNNVGLGRPNLRLQVLPEMCATDVFEIEEMTMIYAYFYTVLCQTAKKK